MNEREKGGLYKAKLKGLYKIIYIKKENWFILKNKQEADNILKKLPRMQTMQIISRFSQIPL